MNKNPKRCTDRLTTKEYTYNQLATEPKNTHRVADIRTSGTAVRSAIVASETLDLKGIAVDGAPIAAERPLTALVRFCASLEEKETLTMIPGPQFQPATNLSMRPLLVRRPVR